MRIVFGLLVLLCLLAAFIQNGSYPSVKNRAFTTGEKLEYRVHYGFITAGEAVITVDEKLYEKNGRTCFRVNVFGRSTPGFDIVLRIRDNWGTYLDTTQMIPHQFYRTIEEGKYRRNEIVYFDHRAKNAEVKVWDRKKNKYKEPKHYKVPNGVQDMVSGYYYLRNIDYSKLKIGEVVSIPAFFEDTLYNFKVKYAGKEMINTKVGDIKAIKIVPLMPENELFEGENAIRVWISDDPNKIPLKIQADMFVGAVEIDIKKYSGLRY
jgi:hypothetical protein